MTGRRRVGLVVDGCAPLWLGGLAAFGIVAAHCLAYVIAEPHAHERALLMDATGHRYWGVVAAIAMGASLAGAAAFLVRMLRPSTGAGRHVNLLAFAMPRLMGLQLAGFALLEVSERTLMGDRFGDVLHEPAFVAGLVLQVVVAIVSSLILCLLTRTLRALLARGRAPDVQSRRPLPRPTTSWLQPCMSLGTGAGTWRGPPVQA
ncbi:MAG: hypothetical protein ACRDJV_03950 [Actinomycetota bacterium]